MGTIGTIFLSEIAGTAMLTLLGCGVVANNSLKKSAGNGGGNLMVYWGWGLGVFAGVYIAYRTGGHLNPAVTIGKLVAGDSEYAPGIPITFGTTIAYFAAEIIGGLLGAVVMYLAYKKQFDNTPDGPTKLGTFSTAPGVRSYGWNVLTEVIGTFVLVFVVLEFGNTPEKLGPLNVALLVLAIGVCLGGPTGYAINPARDLGPRIAHAILPIKDKGSSDWSYSWVPIVGPMIGGILAGVVALAGF
jgi:glycerol uptake facilitator protein